MLQTPLLRTLGFILLLSFSQSPLLAQWDVSTPYPSIPGLEDGMAFDQAGNLYISEYQGTVVRRVAPDGTFSVFAAGFNTPNGLASDGEGNLYVANVFGDRISRVTPEGVVEAAFISIEKPSNVVFNASFDTLYVASYWTNEINKIAVSDPTSISVLASGAPLNGPIGMGFDESGHLFVGNYNDGNIFRITPLGEVIQIASIQSFLGYLVHSNGWLYTTSYNRNQIYRLRPDGSSLEILAGSGAAGSMDGSAETATFNGPNGILPSITGDTLFVSEFNTGTLRMLVSSVPTDVEPDPRPSSPFLDVQSFPNPFHTSTTFSWTLTSPQPVSIVIHDLLGRQVRAYSQVSQQDGTHMWEWDGRDEQGRRTPNATYIVVLRSQEFVETRILIRQ